MAQKRTKTDSDEKLEQEEFPKQHYEKRSYNRYQEEKNVPFSIKKHFEDTKIPIVASELIRIAPQVKADLKAYVSNHITKDVSVNNIQESNLLYLDAKIGEHKVRAIIDPGSEPSIITKRIADKIGIPYQETQKYELKSIGGTTTTMSVILEATIVIQGIQETDDIIIIEDADFDALIGANWIRNQVHLLTWPINV